jgi:hypothetical protein
MSASLQILEGQFSNPYLSVFSATPADGAITESCGKSSIRRQALLQCQSAVADNSSVTILQALISGVMQV